MNHKETTFLSDEIPLNVRIDYVSNPNAQVVIYLPGISGKALSPKTDYLLDMTMEGGFHLVRFNFRCHETGANMNEYSLNDCIADVAVLLEFLEQEGLNLEKFHIIGKSFGGLVAMFVKDSRLGSLALLAPATFISDDETISELRSKKFGEISEVSDYLLSSEYFSDCNVSLLLFHGTEDVVVPLENSERIISLCVSNSELITVPGATHSFERDEDKKIIKERLLEFFRK